MKANDLFLWLMALGMFAFGLIIVSLDKV